MPAAPNAFLWGPWWTRCGPPGPPFFARLGPFVVHSLNEKPGSGPNLGPAGKLMHEVGRSKNDANIYAIYIPQKHSKRCETTPHNSTYFSGAESKKNETKVGPTLHLPRVLGELGSVDTREQH